jgi:hypothetical protein
MKKTLPVWLSLWSAALALGFAAEARADGPYQFFSLTPCRIVDTRGPVGVTGGPSLAEGSQRNFPITGYCGVPATAKAAALNVTFIVPTQSGFLSIWPCNVSMPLVSTINANAGEPAIANGAIVPLADQTCDIAVIYGAQFSGNADVVIDVTGFFQ